MSTIGEQPMMRRLHRFLRRNGFLLLFLTPLVVTVTLFLVYPVIKAGVMSFQHWHLTRHHPDGHPFVGLANFRAVFQSPGFWSSLRITAEYIVVTVAARYVLGLIAALLLNEDFKGRGLFRVLIIIPWAIPVVVACLVWVLMFDYQYGIINHILETIGFLSSPIAYLGDVRAALPAAMVVNIWKGFPWVAIMLLAGLQTIPVGLYEAAVLDGASAWKKFRHVTLPMLRPVSAVVFLLLVVWTVKDFAILYVLTGGGPANSTELLTVYVYKSAFKFFRMGEAAAGGVVLLLISLFFTIIYLKVSRGDEASW